jgi:non-specific serine/threonine protein kinase
VQKSLVVYEEDEHGVGRYRLLETVRQYARERISEAGEGEAVRGRHFDCYLALSRASHSRSRGVDRAAVLGRLETEHHNIRAALTWSMEGDHGLLGLHLAAVVWNFWRVRGYWREGLGWLTALLARTETLGESAERATALTAAGALAWHCGDFASARRLLQVSVPIFRKTEDNYSLA